MFLYIDYIWGILKKNNNNNPWTVIGSGKRNWETWWRVDTFFLLILYEYFWILLTYLRVMKHWISNSFFPRKMQLKIFDENWKSGIQGVKHNINKTFLKNK